MSLLDVGGLSAGYGDVKVLSEIHLSVAHDECVAVLGANAAGKTTMVRALSGEIATEGRILFDGESMIGLLPHERIERGLVQVPEGRQVFPFLTVAENLNLGAYPRRARRNRDATLRGCLEMFPILADRKDQLAGLLSGGEQQMLAIARGLMSSPRLLVLDEPSLGLAPMLVSQVMSSVEDIRSQGVAVLIVEQNVHHALRVADRAYVFETGRVILEGSPELLQADDRVRKAYLGM